MAERIIISLLLIVGTLKMSTAYPSHGQYNQELKNLLKTYTQSEVSDDFEDNEIAEVNYKVKDGVRGLTIFVQSGVLKVYSGAGPNGDVRGTLTLPSATQHVDSTTEIVYDNQNQKKIAFDPYYVEDGGNTVGSVYYFNLRQLFNPSVNMNRGDACTLFVSETDYPHIELRMSVGADGLGNHVGNMIFGQEDYTFWIAFNEKNYILPHTGFYDWEVQIVCVFK